MRLIDRFLVAVLCAGLLASLPSVVAAEGRVALVIGNGSYPRVGVLTNPPNDAKLMAKTLRQVGFDVIERLNVDQKQMKRAIKLFGDRLAAAGPDAVGLFYFAGHGVQVNGTNYLIPVNASIEDEGDVDIEAVSADGVQYQMAYAGNRLNVIILDACRNNPYKRGFRSATRGLARMSAAKGTLIAYATSPGDLAADGSGANSPYTEALSKALMTPGLTVERMFKEVRNTVMKHTGGRQTPWEASSLIGDDFYFGGRPSTPKPVAAPAATGLAPDIVAWQSLPRDASAAEMEAFIAAFPSSPFVGMAKARLQTLKRPPAQAALAPPRPGPPPAPPPDVIAWRSLQNSTSMSELDAFIRGFPASPFVGLARARLDDLKRQQASLTPPAAPVQPAAPVPTGEFLTAAEVRGLMSEAVVETYGSDGRRIEIAYAADGTFKFSRFVGYGNTVEEVGKWTVREPGLFCHDSDCWRLRKVLRGYERYRADGTALKDYWTILTPGAGAAGAATGFLSAAEIRQLITSSVAFETYNDSGGRVVVSYREDGTYLMERQSGRGYFSPQTGKWRTREPDVLCQEGSCWRVKRTLTGYERHTLDGKMISVPWTIR